MSGQLVGRRFHFRSHVLHDLARPLRITGMSEER